MNIDELMAHVEVQFQIDADEIRRLTKDRDSWKARAAEAETALNGTLPTLHAEPINELRRAAKANQPVL